MPCFTQGGMPVHSAKLCLLAAQPWRSCAGSIPERRGYTCGLWLLFHSLAARVSGPTGGVLWMAAVRGFMRQFFQCADCSEHFAGMAAEPEALAVSTPSDALLWSWRAHNRVRRLAFACCSAC